ncbi:MAG: DUF1295 domain-containing protein [Hellea sp.]|nr:DUF1295 domain-containing protein [Hellea sp.]
MQHSFFINLTHAGSLVFGSLILLWALSLKLKDASLVDIFWGFGFLLVAVACFMLSQDKTPYTTILILLPILWGARLTLYLAKRNIGHGEDKRYIAMRKRAERKGLSENNWRLRTLFTIFFGQGLLIMIISTPILFASAHASNSPDISTGPLVYVGVIVWSIGFLFEAIGDAQLSRFMKKNSNFKGNEADKPVLNLGLWKYTRHPNYFGNACIWWGIWLVACNSNIGWITILSPLLMTLLLTRISGRDLLERQMKKRTAYAIYTKKTNSFIPWFPKK